MVIDTCYEGPGSLYVMPMPRECEVLCICFLFLFLSSRLYITKERPDNGKVNRFSAALA